MKSHEFYALIDKYLAGEANQEEIDLLSRYYNSFQRDLDWNEAELGPLPGAETNIFERIQQGLKGKHKGKMIEIIQANESFREAKVLQLNRKGKFFTFTGIAATACVIGLLILGSWILMRNDLNKKNVHAGSPRKPLKSDIAPGGDKAVLKLANGSSIVLDDAQNGALAQQGKTKVIKLNGRLSYQASSASNEILYNTISTPRGGKYQIELADGSQVWLNAVSSLRFPAAFAGKERKVEVTGEVYFEVAKNPGMPFIVSVNGAEVQVLGTHFNVMAYTEEASLKTTLLEGSVKFVSGNETNMLKPGQQSQLLKSGKVIIEDEVDVGEVLAWKNGLFHFNGTDMGTVMRQLSRWYDVDVVYSKHVEDRFYAEIPRNTKLSDVLKALQLTGKVHFEIEGRKIMVAP